PRHLTTPLLPGPPAGAPPPHYSNEYAEMASSRLNATARDTEAAQHAESAAPDRPSSPTGAKRPPGEAMLRDALAQLRKPKVAMAVGGVLAVVLVLILILTGGEKQPQDQVLVLPPPTATEPAPTSAPADSGAGPIEPRSAESHCPPGGTDGMDAFSGEPGKAWSCARAYKVDGQILRIDLGKTYEIQSIGIVPGWDHVGTDGTDQWSKYRTVSRVSYQFDDNDATVLTQDTLDQRTLVVTTLDPPVRASQIVLTVLESTGDATVNTTAISSIVITGR
uniref:discoidin domain-containing protein n=1 Tax=Nocardia cyriacigeorgica TaxID=135487 RepID=UPI0024577710